MLFVNVLPWWMLANLWLTIFLVMVSEKKIVGLDGVAWMVVASIVNPILLYLCGWWCDGWDGGDEDDE